MTARNPNYANQDATNTGSTGTQNSTDADQAKQSVNEVTDQTKQAAAQVTDQAKHAAKSQLATRKDQTAQGLNVVSSAVRDMGDKLRQNDQTSTYAQYADQAANQVQRLGSYLQSRDIGQIANEAENWARRDPLLALGGAFVLGLVAARFLKSSGVQKRSSSSSSGRNTGYNPTYRYNNQRYQYGQYDQYGRYGDNPGYGATNRPTGQYRDDQYGSPGADTKESQY